MSATLPFCMIAIEGVVDLRVAQPLNPAHGCFARLVENEER